MSIHVNGATGCASIQYTHLSVPPVFEHEEFVSMMDRTVAEGKIQYQGVCGVVKGLTQ